MSSTTPAPAVRSTAGDTRAQPRRDGSLISGGQRVAKTLKAAGLDTIRPLCGGHGSVWRG